MKAGGNLKTAKTEALLGCSWQHALEHLHNNPRGLKIGKKNHIDHIKPFAAFSNLACPIQQKVVNHWSNLQLLTKEENIAKGSKHDHDLWSVSEPGMRLIAFERELRKAAEGDGRAMEYVETSDDEFSDDEDESDDSDDE